MIANATIDDLLPVSEYRKKIFTKSRVESSWYKYNGQETCLVTRYIDDLDWYLIWKKIPPSLRNRFSRSFGRTSSSWRASSS